MPDQITEARELIAARLAELDTETEQLRGALAAMGERSQTPRPRGRNRPPARAKSTKAEESKPTKAKGRARRPTRKASAGRAAPGARREELLAAIAANPGARPAELAREIGAKPPQVHALLAKARAEKLVVKSGDGWALSGRGYARKG